MPATTETSQFSRRAWRVVRRLSYVYLAILVGMMFLETWLVYPIPPLTWGDWNPKGLIHEDVHFTAADGTKLHGWFVPRANSGRALLYCHGNGDDVAACGELAEHLSVVLNANVFIFDYRGYGHSEGKPNEAGCIADGTAGQQWLANRLSLKPSDVIMIGRSLGGAVATALAAQNGARALILENTFPTMPDVAAIHYPWLPVRWVMRNRYDSLARIQKYNGPLLQSHGTEDTLIPVTLARTLFDASPSTNKKWLEHSGNGHNDALPRRYYEELAAFLDSITPSAEPAATIEPAH